MYTRFLVLIIGLTAATTLFWGCETLRGARKDVDNTAYNVKHIPENAQRFDNWLQDHWW